MFQVKNDKTTGKKKKPPWMDETREKLVRSAIIWDTLVETFEENI